MRSSIFLPRTDVASLFKSRRWSRFAPFLLGLGLVAAGGACAPPEPPKLPVVAKPKPLEVTAEAPVDLAPVAEPKNLLFLGRVAHAEDSSKLLATWSGFPVPSATEMLRSVADGEIASLVDLGKPVDFVGRMSGNMRAPSLSFVVSVPLVSLEDARQKLARHKLVPIGNGMIRVDGLLPENDEDGSTAKMCVLSPSSGTAKARIVCGDRSGIEALAPYALRTLSAAAFASGDPDLHVEMRVSSVRDSVEGMRRLLPIVIGGFMDSKGGAGVATREIVESTIADLTDFAVDAEKITLDIVAKPEGAKATARYAFKSHQATLTKMLVATDHVGPPPPALLRLPGDVDFAAWASASDKALLERPRKLLAALLEEGLERDVPSADRRALVDSFVSKTLPIALGGWVFGHGFDREALVTSMAAMRTAENSGTATVAADKALSERKRAAFEQMAGYSLARFEKPYADVAQVVKEWVSLGNRMSRSNKSKGGPEVRISATPAALKLPAKTTHVELSVPRPPSHDDKGKITFTPPPVVCHLFVVPGDASVGEQDATWLAAGCDAKLVAGRLSATRTPSGSEQNLGTRPESRELVASVSRSGALLTPRTFAWAKVVGKEEGALGSVGRDGFATVLFTTRPEAPSPDAPGGSVTTTLILPKAAVGASVGAVLR